MTLSSEQPVTVIGTAGPDHSTARPSRVRIVEITSRTWPVFDQLFGPGGVQGGCWCAYFRMTSREFASTTAEQHRNLVRDQVQGGQPFGLVAEIDGEPLSWLAVSPRACNKRLERSVVARVEPGVDLATTWSVTCFYTKRQARGLGLSSTLLRGAVEYAAKNGATVVEAYPIDTERHTVSGENLYHGRLRTFLEADFELIELRGTRRALVRKRI